MSISAYVKPGYANPDRARLAFYVLATVTGIGATLFLLSALVAGASAIAYALAAITYAGLTALLIWGARRTNAHSVTGAWNWSDMLLALAAVGAAFFFFSFVASIVNVFTHAPIANSIETVLLYIAIAGCLALVVLVRRGARLQDLGWRWPRWYWYLAVPVAVGIGLLLTAWVLQVETHLPVLHNAPQTQCTDIKSAFGTNMIGFLLALPVVSLAAPIVEESLFRGFIYGWLQRLVPAREGVSQPWRHYLPLAGAMLLSGLIFGLFHLTYGPLYVLPLGALGVMLAAMYEWSGSLIPGVLTHSTFNTLGAIGLLLAKSSC